MTEVPYMWGEDVASELRMHLITHHCEEEDALESDTEALQS